MWCEANGKWETTPRWKQPENHHLAIILILSFRHKFMMIKNHLLEYNVLEELKWRLRWRMMKLMLLGDEWGALGLGAVLLMFINRIHAWVVILIFADWAGHTACAWVYFTLMTLGFRVRVRRFNLVDMLSASEWFRRASSEFPFAYLICKRIRGDIVNISMKWLSPDNKAISRVQFFDGKTRVRASNWGWNQIEDKQEN